MDESKRITIGKQVLGQADIRGQFTKDGEVWEYEIPTPMLKREIERVIALRIGVAPETFNKAAYSLTRACVYLDNILTRKPDWWEKSDEILDEELIFEVYGAFLDFEDTFRRDLKRGRFRKDGKAS